MIRIMASGYGPFFAIDCNQIDANGEAPVYEVSAKGVAQGKSRVAESFGEFFLNEVKALIGGSIR